MEMYCVLILCCSLSLLRVAEHPLAQERSSSPPQKHSCQVSFKNPGPEPGLGCWRVRGVRAGAVGSDQHACQVCEGVRRLSHHRDKGGRPPVSCRRRALLPWLVHHQGHWSCARRLAESAASRRWSAYVSSFAQLTVLFCPGCASFGQTFDVVATMQCKHGKFDSKHMKMTLTEEVSKSGKKIQQKTAGTVTLELADFCSLTKDAEERVFPFAGGKQKAPSMLHLRVRVEWLKVLQLLCLHWLG
jgi:hypothetical protein